MKLKSERQLVTDTLAILNEALTQDRRAIQYLLGLSEPCNAKLVANDTIQVRADDRGVQRVSTLGLINGILGTLPDGSGPIGAVYDKHGMLVEFIRRG